MIDLKTLDNKALADLLSSIYKEQGGRVIETRASWREYVGKYIQDMRDESIMHFVSWKELSSDRYYLIAHRVECNEYGGANINPNYHVDVQYYCVGDGNVHWKESSRGEFEALLEKAMGILKTVREYKGE